MANEIFENSVWSVMADKESEKLPYSIDKGKSDLDIDRKVNLDIIKGTKLPVGFSR